MSEHFESARSLAVAAEALDYAKEDFPPCVRNQAITVVREMHKLAQMLAEERAAEIYGVDDEN